MLSPVVGSGTGLNAVRFTDNLLGIPFGSSSRDTKQERPENREEVFVSSFGGFFRGRLDPLSSVGQQQPTKTRDERKQFPVSHEKSPEEEASRLYVKSRIYDDYITRGQFRKGFFSLI
ncbi:MAG: hypothetical protein HY461_01805 [Parcubacteria group bacterium]|nr:hypothetical protein [Parcubacteria group bacterium]